MIEPYTPSNGSEAMFFIDQWCSHCARDKAMREGADLDDCDDNEVCDIIGAAFRGPVPQWVEDETGPRCTVFVPAGEALPVVDTLTLDLFEASK